MFIRSSKSKCCPRYESETSVFENSQDSRRTTVTFQDMIRDRIREAKNNCERCFDP